MKPDWHTLLTPVRLLLLEPSYLELHCLEIYNFLGAAWHVLL